MCGEPEAMVMVQVALGEDGALSFAGSSFSWDCPPEELEESIAAILQPLLAGEKRRTVVITAAMYCGSCGKSLDGVAKMAFPLPAPQEMLEIAKEDGKVFEAYVAETLIIGLIISTMLGTPAINIVLMLRRFSDLPHRRTGEAA